MGSQHPGCLAHVYIHARTNPDTLCCLVFVNSIQAYTPWEEGILVRELLLSDGPVGPVGVSLRHLLGC